MPKSAGEPPSTSQGLTKDESKVTPGWEQTLSSPDRVQALADGKMSIKDFMNISGPEMLEMAIIAFQFYEQGRYKEAEALFRGLSNLDPKEPYYMTALGAVYLAQEQLEDALRCFNYSIQVNGKEIASYVNRGEVFLRQGKVMEAAQDFKKAVDLDPTGKDPLVHRARVLAAAALEALDANNKNKEDAGAKKSDKGAAKPAPKAAAAAAKKKK